MKQRGSVNRGRTLGWTLALAGLTTIFSACDRNGSSSGAGRDVSGQSSGRGSGGPANRSTDKTELNARDRNGNNGSDSALAPEEQGASKADLEITRQIRQTIKSDSDFSAEAKNVKIVTVNGRVTLRGPVNNVQEQRAIASIARRVTGVSAIDNQLEVKNNQ